jgi:hypothetical protein
MTMMTRKPLELEKEDNDYSTLYRDDGQFPMYPLARIMHTSNDADGIALALKIRAVEDMYDVLKDAMDLEIDDGAFETEQVNVAQVAAFIVRATAAIAKAEGR